MISPRVKANLLFTAGAAVVGFHWLVMQDAPFKPWKIYNLAIGLFLIWMAILVHSGENE